MAFVAVTPDATAKTSQTPTTDTTNSGLRQVFPSRHVPGSGQLHAKDYAHLVATRRYSGKLREARGSGAQRTSQTDCTGGRKKLDSVYANGASG